MVDPVDTPIEDIMDNEQRPADRAFHQQPALVIGLGGSGVLVVTYLKAIVQSRRGDAGPALRFLGLDVMASPPTVSADAPGGTT